MFNPIMTELVAQEHHNARLAQAEQYRIVKAALAGQPKDRGAWRVSLGELLTTIRHPFQFMPVRRLVRFLHGG